MNKWHKEYYKKNRELILRRQREARIKKGKLCRYCNKNIAYNLRERGRIYHPHCAKFAKQKCEKATKAIVDNYKLKRGCAKCGYSLHSAALDFHHKNPKKKRFIIKQRGWKFMTKETQKELADCIILCANCHRMEHCSQ